jgi:hypothetical protein
VVNFPEVAVIPYGLTSHLLVRREGATWVNVESGLEYGPDLPTDTEYLTRAVDNPDGELCSQIALAHAAFRDTLTTAAVGWRALARTLRVRGTTGNIAVGVAYDVAAGDVEDALTTDTKTLLTHIIAANTRARPTEPDHG